MEIPDIGKAIRIGRIQKDWTQKDVAKKLGLTSAAVSAWEKNVRIPPGNILLQLAKLLDISELLFLGHAEIALVKEAESPYSSEKEKKVKEKEKEDTLEMKETVKDLQRAIKDLEKRLNWCEKKLGKK